MGIFLVYILKSALCLAAFYLFYRLLLSRETLHRFNRVALLGVLLLSAVVPLIEVSTEQPTGVGQGMLTLEEWLALADALAVASPAPVQESRAVWPLVLLSVYVLGVLFFLGRNVWSLFRLGQLLRGTRREDIRRYVPDAPRVLLLVHDRDIAPFSWMRCIVIARRDLETNARPILVHELAHIRLGHSWDLLLADLCCFVQWFNPAAWLLKQELQTVHEYEADEAVLCAGVNAKEYQLLLIKKAVGTRLYSMANSLNHSKLKKRITMMTKEKSSKWACAKYLYVLPLAAVAVAVFARPEVSGVSNKLSSTKVTDLAAIVKEKTTETLPQDTVSPDGLRGKVSGVVYDMVEQAPAFPGGSQAMMQFIKDNLRYPQAAKENGIQGRVILQFVVDETGQVTDPKVVRSIDPSLDAEAIRLVSSMPRWTPGQQDGKAVAVRYTIPVTFSLSEDGALPQKNSVWVIDGKVVSYEEVRALSPADIAKMTVLKGEEAVKKYGEQAQNGAIEITTKKIFPSLDEVTVIGYGNNLEAHDGVDKPLFMKAGADTVTLFIDGVPATEESVQTLSNDQIASIKVVKDRLAEDIRKGGGKMTKILVSTKAGVDAAGQVQADGIVVDVKGEPVVGAIVQEADGTNGVVTDREGRFSLLTSKEAKLKIAFVGYQTVLATAQPKMKITLRAE